MKKKDRIAQLEWDVGMLQGQVDQLGRALKGKTVIRDEQPEQHLPPLSGWVYYSKYGYGYVGSPDDAYIKTN